MKRKYVRCFIAKFLISWYTICMKENLTHYRTCVCNINYHMVWSVKYRRKILNAEVEAYLQELVQEIAEDKGFTVHLFECGEGDHVHCFVSAPPKLSITAIVKYLKGISGTFGEKKTWDTGQTKSFTACRITESTLCWNIS